MSIVTVTSAAASFDLTTLATAKAEMGITGTAQDANIARWIRQASDAIAAHCDRVFGEETVSESFRLMTCFDVLALARRPVSDIDSVTVDGTALDADEYEVDATAGLLYRLNGDDERMAWSAGKVVVVYTAGYALLDSLPHGIERACLLLLRSYVSAAARDPMMKAEQVDGVGRMEYWVGSTNGASGLPPDVEALLRPHVQFSL